MLHADLKAVEIRSVTLTGRAARKSGTSAACVEFTQLGERPIFRVFVLGSSPSIVMLLCSSGEYKPCEKRALVWLIGCS
jgi:hypothetical protein